MCRGAEEVGAVANRDGRRRQGRSIHEKRRLKREKQQTATVKVRKRLGASS